MANIGNLRKRAKEIEDTAGLPDETGVESIISNAAKTRSEESIIDPSVADDMASLTKTQSIPTQKPAESEVPIPAFKMPEPELDDEDDDEDFDLPEVKAPETPKPAEEHVNKVAQELPVEEEKIQLPTLPPREKSKGLPTSPAKPNSPPNSDLWMFSEIAVQMINKARGAVKPDGIDSDKYWDEILNKIQK